MWMTIKLAWRNLFRNRRRTLIAGTAIGVGLAALIFTDALMIGMADHMIHSATASFMGEAQIHGQGYRESRDENVVIHDVSGVMNQLDHDKRVAASAMRVMGIGTIASPAELRPAVIWGVDPKRESAISQVKDAISSGHYLGTGKRELVIGQRLAVLLQVVITVARAGSGELSQQLFRVTGIYRFGSKEMDEGMAFVQLGTLQHMLGLEGKANEIAIRFRDRQIVKDPHHPFYSEYSTDGNEAVGWQTLMPQLAVGLNLIDMSMLVVGLILFGVVSLGIINTLFMSIYERMFEFGVLKAIGTRPYQIFRLIVLEAGLLALVSIVLGLIIGVVVTSWVAHIGIDYRGIEMMGVTMSEMIYPRFTIGQFWKYPLWVLGMTTVVGMYPAFYAARLIPARAMRKSL
ncbi:MAG: hypothetical protein CO090_03320 [Acidobacteria bacterium CG_4_9_14_3_um_filter_49_7]|nr:MAG: hypothetical protein CO090_03320 [Acidobacteria bacterium CG_4_9_14_3_um_filter_49_7]